MVSFEDFSKIELKVGTVVFAESLEESEKLIRLQVDLGEDGPRQVFAGMKQWLKPEDLIGKQVIVVANLEPRKMMGLESQGMILAADSSTSSGQVPGPVLLTVAKEVPPGTKIR